MRIIYITLLNCLIVFAIKAQSSLKQYPMPETAGTTQWIKLGTYTAVQLGETIKISIISHIGYNASNDQDFQTNIFFKTSNGGNTDVNGFAGNSQYYSTGPAAGGFYEAKWVSNLAGISATSYDLYIKLGAFTRGSTYTVENSFGTWTHIGELRGANDPGLASSSICKAIEQFVIGSQSYFNKSQFIKESQYFYNRLNNNSIKVFGMANDDDRLKIWSNEGGNTPWYERLTIIPNGNVGIGISNPIYKLHIVGQNYVAGPTSGYVFEDRSNPTKAFQWYADGGSAGLYNQATSTQPLTISPAGNLGIATTNPTQRLDVFGAINVHTHVISQNSGFISSGQTWLAPNPSGKKRFYMDIVADNYARLGTYNEVDETSFNLAINPYGGNTGIGTISPTQKVEIAGTAYVNAENNGFVVDAANLSRVGLMKYGGIEAALVHGNQTPLRFGQVNQASVLGGIFTEQMRIDNNGNVGIGTSNPTKKLEIGGLRSMTFDSNLGLIKMKADAGGWAMNYGFTGSTGTDLGGFWGYGGANDLVQWSIGKAYTDNFMVVKSNGQVTIGTFNSYSDYKLSIAGNVIADKVKVKKSANGVWPDFVFSPTYKLPNLSEIETFVKQNSHLPEIPSANEIEKEGQDLGEMNRLLLKKVEELTLYLIEIEKKNKEQDMLIQKLLNK